MSNFTDLLQESVSERPVILYSGDEPVAKLVFRQTDYPWVEYKFTALEGWGRLGSAGEVFSRGAREGMEGIHARVRAIEEFNLTLVSDDGSIRIRDFLLHVRDDRALVREFRPQPQ